MIATLPESDLDLLTLYREQADQDAFAEIVRRYAPAVFAAAMRVLGDRARADDVSQETFFRLSQKPQSVSQSLGGWLHTAATRLAIDAARSETSRAHREAAYEPAPASEVTLWSEISPHVDQALADLPDDFRLLLVRHFLMGKTQCQLAAEMSASPASVCRKIKLGVEALRARLRAKGVIVSLAVLTTLLREHSAGAAALPTALVHELGKITMLSGKPITAAPISTFAGSPGWVFLTGLLAVTFGIIAWAAITGAPTTHAAPQVPVEHRSR